MKESLQVLLGALLRVCVALGAVWAVVMILPVLFQQYRQALAESVNVEVVEIKCLSPDDSADNQPDQPWLTVRTFDEKRTLRETDEGAIKIRSCPGVNRTRHVVRNATISPSETYYSEVVLTERDSADNPDEQLLNARVVIESDFRGRVTFNVEGREVVDDSGRAVTKTAVETSRGSATLSADYDHHGRHPSYEARIVWCGTGGSDRYPSECRDDNGTFWGDD